MSTWKKTGYGALALLAALIVWGVGVEPHLILSERHEVASVPALPAAWVGRRVAVLADLHIGMPLGNPGMSRRAVRRLLELRPDVVLIAGDFVVGAADEPETVAEAVEIVAALPRAGIATYAVLGNHDYSVAWRSESPNARLAGQIRTALEAAGIPVLDNRAAALRIRSDAAGGRLHLVGIGSDWAHRADPAAALRGVPAGAARAVFMHNPYSFRAIPAGAAPFAVAGHTHGGDVRIPGFPHWSWLDLVQHRRVPADGWAEAGYGQAGNRLYVNRGIGNSTVPLRINDPPELTLFTLRAAPAPRPSPPARR